MDASAGVAAALPGIGALFAESWALFKARFRLLLLVGGVGAALTMASAAAPFLAVLPVALAGGAGYWPWLLASLISLSGILWFGSWAQVALSEAVLNPAEGRGVLELYRGSWSRIVGFSWVCLLIFIFVAGGMFLFILPGVYLGVALLFAPFVYLAEGLSGMDALVRSVERVRGRWLAAAGRLLVLGLASALLSHIPFIGPFTGIVTGPFGLVYAAVLYRSLQRLQPAAPAPSARAKLLLASTALGLLFPAAGAIKMIPALREFVPALETQAQYLLEHPGDPQAAEKALSLLEGGLTPENVKSGLELIQVSTAAPASGAGP